MQQKIKNAQYEFKTSTLKGYHEVIVSFSVYGVEQKSVIFVRDHAKWKDVDYFNEAKKQFNKKIESGEIKIPKHQPKRIAREGGKGRSKLLIAFTSIFAATTIALGGFIAYQYFTGGFGGGGGEEPGPQPGPEQKYTVTWLNWDGSQLEYDENLETGDIPSFDYSQTPYKPYDGARFWHFKGWKSEIKEITNFNQIYVADFEEVNIAPDIDYYTKIILNSYDVDVDVEFEATSSGTIEVDWGDGTATSTLRHTYTRPGDYDIKIKNVTNIKYKEGPNIYRLKEIYFGDGINIDKIDDRAFNTYYALNSINVPSTVTSIGVEAFRNCESLQYIDLPEGLEEIGGKAFQGCKSLKSITLPAGLTNLGSDGSGDDNGYTFDGAESLQYINIPNGVQEISQYTFNNCKRLKTIDLGVGVQKISKYAFCNCNSLESIDLSNVNFVDEYAFRGCWTIKSINMKCSAVFEYTFYHCYGLETVVLDNVEYIHERAFEECSNLKNITLSDRLIQIDNNAFSRCEQFESIKIPNTVTYIGNYAFSVCDKLVIDLTAFSVPDSTKIPNVGTDIITATCGTKLKVLKTMLETFTQKEGWPTDESKYITVDPS